MGLSFHPSTSFSIHFPIPPSQHLSTQSYTPTGFNICLLTKWSTSWLKKEKKAKASPLWFSFRFTAESRPVLRDIICIHRTKGAHPSSPGGSLIAGWSVRRFVIPVEAWSLMFRLNCNRIDVDTIVAGSENWHERGDLAGQCRKSAVSKCDVTPCIRSRDTVERWRKKNEARVTPRSILPHSSTVLPFS